MVFKLLTGKNLGMKRPSQFVKTLSPFWDDFTMLALEDDLEDRFNDATEMLAHLPEEKETFDQVELDPDLKYVSDESDSVNVADKDSIRVVVDEESIAKKRFSMKKVIPMVIFHSLPLLTLIPYIMEGSKNLSVNLKRLIPYFIFLIVFLVYRIQRKSSRKQPYEILLNASIIKKLCSIFLRHRR